MERRKTLIFVMWLYTLAIAASRYEFVSGRGLVCSWSVGDVTSMTTGVVGAGGMNQRAYPVVSVEEGSAKWAKTNSVGFKLSANTQYYSYMPYMWSDNFDATKICMSYTGQKQDGNDNADGLYRFDLCAARVTTDEAAECNARYFHVGSVMRIVMPIGRDIVPNMLRLDVTDGKLREEASINLLTQQLTSSILTNSMTLYVGGVRLKKGDVFVAYMMLPPVDLSDGKMALTLTGEDGSYIVMPEVLGPDMRNGKLYNLDFTASGNKTVEKASPVRKAQGLEYPRVYIEDIEIDDSYVGYVPALPNGIRQVEVSSENRYYTLCGREASAGAKGIVVVRLADGSTKKYYKK